MDTRLPSIRCVECGALIDSGPFTPNHRGGAPRASGYPSCLRKCEACGIGFSNAKIAKTSHLTLILRDPFAQLPTWISEDSNSALKYCLNKAHATKKQMDFQSLYPEDHVTWTVTKLLKRERALGRMFGHPGDKEPNLLIWGVPIPYARNPEGHALRQRVIALLNGFGEHSRFRTEPDLVLDFGDNGLVIVEAKLFSPNDKRPPDYAGWRLYLSPSAFHDVECARTTGLYQLVRNWRLGIELAAGRPFTLVNLAPTFTSTERSELACLRIACGTTATRHVCLRNWANLLASISIPDWFPPYAQRRGVPFRAGS